MLCPGGYIPCVVRYNTLQQTSWVWVVDNNTYIKSDISVTLQLVLGHDHNKNPREQLPKLTPTASFPGSVARALCETAK